MKLDATVMRTMNRQDYRVLGAVEAGMKNHALVPAAMVGTLSNLRHGGTSKILSSLLRDKLVSHDRSCGYDGYRLTNSGYDVLCLNYLKEKGWVAALGDRIGTGKESDVYVAASPEGRQIVLKIHRLGRTSFRDVKNKRDYFHTASQKNNNNQAQSWLFLSKLSARKEYAYMKALYEVGYPTPQPLGHNRHIVVMGLIRGMPLYQIPHNRLSDTQKASIFQQTGNLANRLLQHGLVHCDLNEFNLLVDLSGGTQTNHSTTDNNTNNNDVDTVADHYVRHTGLKVEVKGALSAHLHPQLDGTGEAITEPLPEPMAKLDDGTPKPIVTLIDFPQMVSVHHPNAEQLYQRDLSCLRKFFLKKLKCDIDTWTFPPFSIAETSNNSSSSTIQKQVRLDQQLQASGYTPQDAQRDKQLYYFQNSNNDDDNDNDDDKSKDTPPQWLVETDTIPENKETNNDNKEEEETVDAKKIIQDPMVDLDFQIDLSEQEQPQARIIHMDDNESLAASIFTEQSYAIAEQRARIRVQHHIQKHKKSANRKNAFKHRNSNKTFHKGKRVFQDHSLA